MRAKVAAFVGASALLLSASTASAQLLVYEGFDYATGTDNIPTLNGGIGFTGAWGAGGGTESVMAASLGYTDSLGNILQTSGGSGYFTGSPGATSMSRTFTARGDGTTTWISFVAERFGPDFYWAASVQFRSGETGAATEKLAIGEVSENNATVGADAANNWWSLYNQAGLNATTANSADGFLITDQSFVVLRVDNTAGATDSVRMWINPTLWVDGSSLLPDDSSALVTLTGLDLTFDRIRIFSRQGGAVSGTTYAPSEFAVDELRLGESFASVATAIPEPSTYAALLGGLTLGLAAWRRARRERRD